MMQELQDLLEKKSKDSSLVSLPYSTGTEDCDQCTKHQIMIEEQHELLEKESKDSGIVSMP